MSKSSLGVVSCETSRKSSARKWRELSRVFLFCALGAMAFACGSEADPGGDSSTHFWRECSADEQCGSDLQCLCGHCSNACNRATDCADPTAVCVSAQDDLACSLGGNLCALGESLGSDASVEPPPPPTSSDDLDVPSSGEPEPSDAASPNFSGEIPATSVAPSATPDAGTSTGPMDQSSPVDSGAASPSDASSGSTSGWTQVQIVDEAAGSAFSPAVTLDAQGNAVAVWSSSVSDGGYTIVAKYYSDDQGWDEGTTLATSSTLLTGVCIAGNPDGAAVAAWIAMGDSTSQLWAATFTPDAGWVEPVAIGPESPSVSAADCAVDTQGNALLVFSDHDGNKSLLHAARFEAGAGWGDAERLDQTDFNVSAASLAFDGSGNALVLWNAWLGNQSELWSNRYLAGEGWQAPVSLVAAAETNLQSVDVALDDAGDGIGVWTEQTTDGTQTTAWAGAFTADGNWGEAEQLTTGSAGLSGLAVGISNAGVAVTVWEALSQAPMTENEPMQQNRIWSRQLVESVWSEPGLLAEDAAHVSLAVSGGGRAVAVWRTPLDYMVDGDIVGAIFDEGAGFGTATTFAEASDGDSLSAWASINDEGRARIVWQHTTGGEGNIVSNELR
ncbi:MAG TPA: hypothetical protein VHM70_08325 [Polyangiaceae bacterium]|nr:hypothetical protein [Polyangiaceae bacterium]